jgi:hypothetical protein
MEGRASRARRNASAHRIGGALDHGSSLARPAVLEGGAPSRRPRRIAALQPSVDSRMEGHASRARRNASAHHIGGALDHGSSLARPAVLEGGAPSRRPRRIAALQPSVDSRMEGHASRARRNASAHHIGGALDHGSSLARPAGLEGGAPSPPRRSSPRPRRIAALQPSVGSGTEGHASRARRNASAHHIGGALDHGSSLARPAGLEGGAPSPPRRSPPRPRRIAALQPSVSSGTEGHASRARRNASAHRIGGALDHGSSLARPAGLEGGAPSPPRRSPPRPRRIAALQPSVDSRMEGHASRARRNASAHHIGGALDHGSSLARPAGLEGGAPSPPRRSSRRPRRIAALQPSVGSGTEGRASRARRNASAHRIGGALDHGSSLARPAGLEGGARRGGREGSRPSSRASTPQWRGTRRVPGETLPRITSAARSITDRAWRGQRCWRAALRRRRGARRGGREGSRPASRSSAGGVGPRPYVPRAARAHST